MSYLLQEDGVSRIILEDGSGFLLLEDGIGSSGFRSFRGKSRIRITSEEEPKKEIFPWQDLDQP